MDYRSKPIPVISPLSKKFRKLTIVKRLHNALWGKSYRAVVTWATLICVIAAGSVGGAAIYAKFTGGSKLQKQLDALQEAVTENDLEAASKALTELVKLQPYNKRYGYRLALADQKLGRDAGAHARMLDLVEARYARAALWIAEQDFDRSTTSSWDADTHAAYFDLLKLANEVKEESDFIRAKHLMATYLLERGEWSEAVEHLVDLSRFQPEARLHAASVCELHGDHDRSKQYARTSQLHFAAKLQQQPRDISTRLNLARSMLLLGEEKGALQLLSVGFELTQQSTLQQAGGEVLVAWAKRLAREDPVASLIPRSQLIHRATQCAPGDTSVVTGLLRFINECALNPEDCIALFQRAAATGGDHESLHFMLALVSLDRKDTSTASQHFELAQRAGSHLPTVLNNLAIAVLQNDDPDRALRFATAANELLPDQPHLCEVRGRILVKLNRCEEAIRDLQVGLQAKDLKAIVLPNLLLAYQATGRNAEASELQRVESE